MIDVFAGLGGGGWGLVGIYLYNSYILPSLVTILLATVYMCVDMCLPDTLDSTIAKTIIILNHFDIWQYNFVCLICCYYLMLIKIISFYFHIWMDINEVYMDWHIQNMQWNCQASNYMKKVCFSMAILFCQKSHITCPSEKNEDWKGWRWKFQGRFSDSTVDYTCFGFLKYIFHFQSLI